MNSADIHTQINNRILIEAAGLDAALWDNLLADMVAREIRDCVPDFVARFVEISAWGWPLRLAGLKVFQLFPGERRQSILIGNGAREFCYTGQVSGR